MVLKFILLELCVGIASLVTFYLAIVLTWYSYYQRKQETTTAVQSLITNNSHHPPRRNDVDTPGGTTRWNEYVNPNTSNKTYENNELKGNVAVTSNHAVALERLCIASVWFVLVRYLSEHVTLLFAVIDLQITTYCDVINKLHVGLYLLPFTLEYTFLWLQQRVVYFHPLLGHNRCSTLLSWTAYLSLILGEIATFALFLISVRFDHRSLVLTNSTLNDTLHVCISSPQSTIAHFIPWISMAGFTLVFQCCFLILFIKPLFLCGNTLRRIEGGVCHYETHPFQLLKRLFMVFGICFATDIVSFGGAVVANDFVVANVVLDINLLINFICLLLTYKDWKTRVFPCRSKEITPSSSRSDTRCITVRTPVSSVSTNVDDVFDDH